MKMIVIYEREDIGYGTLEFSNIVTIKGTKRHSFSNKNSGLIN